MFPQVDPLPCQVLVFIDMDVGMYHVFVPKKNIDLNVTYYKTYKNQFTKVSCQCGFRWRGIS
jgi:hypothetical protein